jgi:predicted metal-dependent phosphoesterase TrpH
MPTTLPRTQVTHTREVRHALEVAARRWPGQRPSVLLAHLIEEGAHAIEADAAGRDADRRDRVESVAARLATDFGHLYTDDYLAEERAGWDA